jgi:hypothetical protein
LSEPEWPEFTEFTECCPRGCPAHRNASAYRYAICEYIGNHSLIKGTADGKIEIVNERPKVTKGIRKVVDVVSRGRAAVKETAEADVEK